MMPHKFAEIFPAMDDKQFRLLVASIREHGQQEPIVIYKGKILDGRNRKLACANLQIKPKTVEYTGKDPLAFVMAANLHRRHLTASQRAMVAAKVADMKVGQDKRSKLPEGGIKEGVSVEEAAEQLSVSPRSVQRAKAVQASGDEELIEAVEQGKVTVTSAARSVKPEHEPPAPTQPDRFWRKDFERLIAKATSEDIHWAVAYLGRLPK
jgi:ParB-like chromosome segregation protein Spo0J